MRPAREHVECRLNPPYGARGDTRRVVGGQATVELVAMLPIAALVALAAGQLLAAGAAREHAGHAAQAAAMALLQGGDPEDAARASVPHWSGRHVSVRVRDRAVRVRVRPASVLPGLSAALTAEAQADAGPVP